MIDIKTKIHDKFSVEFKVGFVTRRKVKKNDFTVGMWLFVPSSLDITPATYTKNDFYRDVKTNIRLITPSFILRDIVGGDAIPLRNVEAASKRMASEPTRTNVANYAYQVKMFAAIVKSAQREERDFIAKAPTSDLPFLIGNYTKNVKNIIAEFCKLRDLINTPSVPAEALEAYTVSGDFICTISVQHSCRILENLEKKGIDKDLRDDLISLVRYINDVRHERGYSKSTDVYRHGILKKAVESQLYLRVPKKRDGVLVEQAYYSLAAGLAMLFATVVAWAFQRRFGNLTWPLFIALIISYMMKDRIKELMRYYFAHRVGDRYFDNKARIQLHDRKIGVLKEAVDFIPHSKVPADVMAKREEGKVYPLAGVPMDERVILYKKTVKVDRAKMTKDASYQYSGVNDIIRFQIGSFLRKMDNPQVEVDTIDEDGNLKKTMCPKNYYLNVVLQYHYDDITDYKHFRITLTRDGIQKIEEL